MVRFHSLAQRDLKHPSFIMEKTKQAVDQQEVTVKTVQLQGKESSSFLVPDLQEGQILAVVDEGVLEFLTSLLPKANVWDIITKFVRRMDEIKNDPCTLDAAVDEAKRFVTFHTSVNLLRRYFDPKTLIYKEKPFNVVEELTITEKSLKINEMKEQIMKWELEIDKYNDEQEAKENEERMVDVMPTVVDRSKSH